MGIKRTTWNPPKSVDPFTFTQVLTLLIWVGMVHDRTADSYFDIHFTIMLLMYSVKPLKFFSSADLLWLCTHTQIIWRNWIEWGYKYNVISAPQAGILWHWYWHYAELISFNPKQVALDIHPSLILMHENTPNSEGWKCETSQCWFDFELGSNVWSRRLLDFQFQVRRRRNKHGKCVIFFMCIASPGRTLLCLGVVTMKTHTLCNLPIQLLSDAESFGANHVMMC